MTCVIATIQWVDHYLSTERSLLLQRWRIDRRMFLISRLSPSPPSPSPLSSLPCSSWGFSGTSFLSWESLRSSTSSMVGICRCFCLCLRLLLRRFLKGSRRSLRGMRLLWTMCLATLFLIFLPKLLRALERMMEVALAMLLNSSCFFCLVRSFSTSLILSSISFSTEQIRYPRARFSFTCRTSSRWHPRTRQYFTRQARAKRRRKASRKTTRAEEARMMMFLVRSNLLSCTSRYDSSTLLPTYCSTKTNFLRSHSAIISLRFSLSRPLVPQERSSILQKAKTWRMLMQVGEKQMQETTEVTISTPFLKLQLHRMGRANPAITNRISARRQISGMKNCSLFPMGSSVVFWIIAQVLQMSSANTSRPYSPISVEAPQQMTLNLLSLLLTMVLQRTTLKTARRQAKLKRSGMERSTFLSLKMQSTLQLASSKFSLSRKNSSIAGTRLFAITEIRVRFIVTQNSDGAIHCSFCVKLQYSSCTRKKMEGLQQLCSRTQLKANQEPLIHLLRCPSSLVSEVTGSTEDSASGRQCRSYSRAWIPRQRILSSARYMLESSSDRFTLSESAVFRYLFSRVSDSSSSSVDSLRVQRSVYWSSLSLGSDWVVGRQRTLLRAFQRQPEKAPGSTCMQLKQDSKGLSSMWAQWYSNCCARWMETKWLRQRVKQSTSCSSQPSRRQPRSSAGFSILRLMQPQTPPHLGLSSMCLYILKMASSWGLTPTSVSMQQSGSKSLQKPSKKSMWELSLPEFLCLTQRKRQLQSLRSLSSSRLLNSSSTFCASRGLRRQSFSMRTGQRMVLSWRESRQRWQRSCTSNSASYSSLSLVFLRPLRYSWISSWVSNHRLFYAQKLTQISSYLRTTSRGSRSTFTSLAATIFPISSSSPFVFTYCSYWFSKSRGLSSCSSSSVKRLICPALSSLRALRSILFSSTSLRNSSRARELERCLKPFLMSISLKKEIMFSVWSLEALRCSIPSKTTTTMISCDMMPALARKSLLLSWMPFMVVLSMCLGSLQTQMQMASLMCRSLVRLKRESSPWPAGCQTRPYSSFSGLIVNLFIWFSSIMIGLTSSSSHLSGCSTLRFTTLIPSSLSSRISHGCRKILGKKSCIYRILSQSGSSRCSFSNIINLYR